ncbi:hypothetical protein [Nonomuraea insulae]|uniref:Polymerase nucleotidyl transferase domain-containing protein n=1 Tax=Nonomuraea insulae TaxID=1616787 RepID=A0ABW1CN38_9ACTN
METFEDFLGRVGPDPQALGLVLSGSQAREGTATARSDHDLYLIVAKATLTPSEAEAVASEALGAFLNSAYRCLKNDRDGNLAGALLDGAEAVPYFLTYVFASHGRLRPYNKYLGWELRRHPLEAWTEEELLPRLDVRPVSRGPASRPGTAERPGAARTRRGPRPCPGCVGKGFGVHARRVIASGRLTSKFGCTVSG